MSRHSLFMRSKRRTPTEPDRLAVTNDGALIQEAAVIGRIRPHLGLPTDLPVARPARAPPLLAASEAQLDVYESLAERTASGLWASVRRRYPRGDFRASVAGLTGPRLVS